MKHKNEHEERAWEMLKKSIGPRIWSDADLGYFFGAGLLFGILMTLPLVALADNQITIEQAGDNLNLTVEQVGANNIIKMQDAYSYINSSNLNLLLVQYNDTNTSNQIVIDEMSGSGNTVRLAQGAAWSDATSSTYSYDGLEGGGHYIEMDLYGNNNHLQGHQTNQGGTTGHDFNFHLAGNNNDIWFRQQHDGGKDIDLVIYNSDNDATIRQKGNGAAHSATITLDGIYGTTLNLLQQGTTTQTYSLSVDCYTVGGCSASVTQGQ
jgi:hypothetical protein